MPDYAKILAYLRSVPPNEWHPVRQFAPKDPVNFLQYVRMLPDGCYEVKGDKFMIVGLL